MPRAKPFDKRTATTYALVNRPQNDPLIHDTDAPSQVFTEIGSSARGLKKSKVKHRGDLEDEFGLGYAIRANEGEAAEHGVYYDDSNYDYMQHMRDIGGSTNSVWIEAKTPQKGKGKAKQSLEDAIRDFTLDDTESEGGVSLASRSTAPYIRSTIEQQQDVPDELSGLQLDMDPRLREVLTALEDEEYVDDDEDVFAELTADKEEMDIQTWEDTLYDHGEDEDGWESDRTEKPTGTDKSDIPGTSIDQSDLEATSRHLDSHDEQESADAIPAPPAETQNLFADLARPRLANESKPTIKNTNSQKPQDLASSAVLSSASQFGRRKKRKGALTSSTSFSMTSSSLARTEPLSILDSRFDKIAESYMEDGENADIDDSGSMISGMTGLSKASGMSRGSAWGGSQASEAPQLMPATFNTVLDEFIGGANGQTKGRLMRKSGQQGRWQKGQGMAQLDEIRSQLGPARIRNYERSQKA